MQKFIITIYDIKDIASPKHLEEITVETNSKAEALDIGHQIAFEKFPEVKRMITTRKETCV